MTPEFAADLVAALAKLATIDKGKTAKIPTKSGGEYSYSYADIADVVKVTRTLLAEHGILALTPVHAHDDGLAVSVELIHKSGESKVFPPLSFPHGADAQATGSAITYHRRYALVAALGIAADDDDDGANATPRQARRESGGTSGPTEKQLGFAKSLADDLGTAALTVVPSIIEEVTGRKAKLSELTRDEIKPVIDQLKEESAKAKKADRSQSKAHDAQLASAVAKAAAGEEPWDEAPFEDAS
jgi:hypothetical protein